MEQSPAELKLLHCSSWKTNGSEPESPSMQSAMVLSGQGMELMSEESQNQLRWDRAMCNELGLPQGYGKVSVLLVKWNNEEDQFKQTEEEVSRPRSIVLQIPTKILPLLDADFPRGNTSPNLGCAR